MLKNIFLIFAILCFTTVTCSQNKSVYTDLDDAKCKTVELSDDEGGSYSGICPGTASYKLNLIEGDLRQTITVIDPKNLKHELQFWNFLGGFSAVGPKAEWRLKGKTPVALIIRLNVNETPEEPNKSTSYLIVAKITRDEICVTDTLKPSRSQNAEARKIADKASDRPCKSQG